MASQGPWSPPPTSLKLENSEIHVWRAALQGTSSVLQRFESFLSPIEKERAGKFLVSHAKQEFVVSRGILRELLGTYVGKPPTEISMNYGPYGKPFLSGSNEPSPLHFNASHSHGYGVFAFALTREVGVDVEQVRAEVATEEIAGRFFSEAENAELATLPPQLRAQGFFRCWTRKEAYIKARGLGLQIPLKSFHVSIMTDETQLIGDGEGSIWTLHPFEPAPSFVGAVAAAGTDWRVRYFDCQVTGG